MIIPKNLYPSAFKDSYIGDGLCHYLAELEAEELREYLWAAKDLGEEECSAFHDLDGNPGKLEDGMAQWASEQPEEVKLFMKTVFGGYCHGGESFTDAFCRGAVRGLLIHSVDDAFQLLRMIEIDEGAEHFQTFKLFAPSLKSMGFDAAILWVEKIAAQSSASWGDRSYYSQMLSILAPVLQQLDGQRCVEWYDELEWSVDTYAWHMEACLEMLAREDCDRAVTELENFVMGNPIVSSYNLADAVRAVCKVWSEQNDEAVRKWILDWLSDRKELPEEMISQALAGLVSGCPNNKFSDILEWLDSLAVKDETRQRYIYGAMLTRMSGEKWIGAIVKNRSNSIFLMNGVKYFIWFVMRDQGVNRSYEIAQNMPDAEKRKIAVEELNRFNPSRAQQNTNSR